MVLWAWGIEIGWVVLVFEMGSRLVVVLLVLTV